MKKFLLIVIALVTTLSLAACDSSTESESGSSSSSETSSSAQESSGENSSENSGGSSAPGGEEFPFTEETLPKMDGSTSAVPLEIGLKSGFLGIPYAEAKELVSHTTTHDSFKRLINGEVDMIFSVPISAEQQKAADDAGVKLIMKPVAREGFVFVVNGQNPVDGLTSEQLRKIYSGEITNWKEVGGNDEPIIPYQRNTDSGSQNYMTVFMGDTPLLKPKIEYIAHGMGGLMDAVAVYDNSAGAIGYSVYSYAAQMYENADKVKFIAIDGVKPSKATMADESYPLLSSTYIIYTDKSPESAAKFTEEVLSDKGQNLVLESGYLPVNGMDVPEKYLPYEANGTGAERPADFKPSDKCSYFNISTDEFERYRIHPFEINGKYYEFKSGVLENTELQESINGDIRAAMDRLRLKGWKFSREEKELRDLNSHFFSNCIDDISFHSFFCNGYLSIILGYSCMGHPGDILTFFKAETLTYDLFSGKKIERYSDLFYKDEEFLPDVSLQFAKSAARLGDSGRKADYSGILGEPRLFTINGILLEENNLYFDYSPLLEYDDKFSFHSPVTEYRDMRPLFKGNYASLLSSWGYNNEWEIEYIKENDDIYARYTGSSFHTAAEVKAKDELWYGLQKRFVERFRKDHPEWHLGGEINFDETETFYSLRYGSMLYGTAEATYDKKTLELIDYYTR